MSVRGAGLAVVLWFVCGAVLAGIEVRVASSDRPPVLDREIPEAITALAVSPDGSRMAYAVPSPHKSEACEIRWIDAAQAASEAAATITLAGTVRDLLFLADNRTLLGLGYRPAKKLRGDAFLFTWSGGAKVRRLMPVPPSSSDLDLWPGGNAILLAARNEVRTILVPGYRSGPLYGVPGDNLAVTSLGHSSYVVVGQLDELLLVDLAAPSGRRAMPVLARQPVDAPVAALADFPDGREVLVRLRDHRLYRLAFEPAGWHSAGYADRIVGLAKAEQAPVFFAPALAERPGGEAPAPPSAAAPPVSAPPTAEPEAAESAPVTAPPGEASAQPGAPVGEPRAAPGPPRAETLAAPGPSRAEALAPAAGDAARHQLRGTLAGSFRLVGAVVLLGPDNILREAARVRPDADGTWKVDGLVPGRYRIQLDAGGDRVLVTEPRFLMLDVGAAPGTAPEIKVLRSF